MDFITPEIETEAAIWAEGTRFTKSDILKAYSQHVANTEEPLGIQEFCEVELRVNPAGSRTPPSVEVTLCHRSSIAGARWCRPIGWSPRNQIEGADWDECGAWLSEDSAEAGLVVFRHDGSEGETVTVVLDDLRVASSGDCRVIGEVEIDFA